ncbi:MAG: hypothetical protein RL414_795 [Actinomycetota bacterium]|jgi:hypothetical protein
MRYLISGASSSLAKTIALELEIRGHATTLVGRNSQPRFDFLNLGESLPFLFDSHDVFLHFAHSFEMQVAPDLNEQAALEITKLIQGKNSTVKKCIYISSDSASAVAKSDYGKSKFRTERVFLNSEKCAVIRLGIINDVNVESPYKKVRDFVEKFGVLPFPNPKKRIFTVTRIKVIVENIEKIVRMNLIGGPYKDEASSTVKSILEILESDGVKPKIVLRIPKICLRFLIFVGGRFKFTRRIADSMISILTEPETSQQLPHASS